MSKIIIKKHLHPMNGAHAAYMACAKSITQNKIFYAPFGQSDQQYIHYFDCTTRRFGQFEIGFTLDKYAYIDIVWDPVYDRMMLCPYIQARKTKYHYIDCVSLTFVEFDNPYAANCNAHGYKGIEYSPNEKRAILVPYENATWQYWHFFYCDETVACGQYEHNVTAVNQAYAGGKHIPSWDRIIFTPSAQSDQLIYHYYNCITHSIGQLVNPLAARVCGYFGGDIDPINNVFNYGPNWQILEQYLHRVNLDTFTIEIFENTAVVPELDGANYYGLKYTPSIKSHIMIPAYQSSLPKYHTMNCETNNFEEYDNPHIVVEDAFINGCLNNDNEVFLSPFYSGENLHWYSLKTRNNVKGGVAMYSIDFTLPAINENLNDSLHFIDLSLITGVNVPVFWNAISSDGSNIRIIDSEGNEMSVYIDQNTFDKVNQKGCIVAQLDIGTEVKTYTLQVDDSIETVSDSSIFTDDGCILSFGFDNKTGAVLTNRYGSHNATIYGSPTLNNEGLFGLEIALNGTSQYFDTDTLTELVANSAKHTIILIAKQDTIDVSANILDMRDSTSTFYIATNSNGNLYSVIEQSSTVGYARFDYSNVITQGERFIYCQRYDGALSGNSKLEIEINKVSPSLIYSGTIPSVYCTTNRPMTIGRIQTVGQSYWNGSFDELLFYNVTKTKAYTDYINDELNGTGITWGDIIYTPTPTIDVSIPSLLSSISSKVKSISQIDTTFGAIVNSFNEKSIVKSSIQYLFENIISLIKSQRESLMSVYGLQNTNESDQNLKKLAPIGSKRPLKVDLENTDFMVPDNCRMISSTSGTIIMVDMKTVDGTIEDVPLPAPGLIPIINVTKIKKSGTDAGNIVVWPFE